MEEPCIVFSPHWSLRLGLTLHLLHRWCQDDKSLLVLENELNPEIALFSLKPMEMKVLQCSFLTGIKACCLFPVTDDHHPLSNLVLFLLFKFVILVDCPLDLSALTVFPPVITEPYSELNQESSNCGR
ncbi:hypothetical protein ACFE04_001858 [Oxalis oulophora]